MKLGTQILTVCALILPLALPSWAQVRTLPTQTRTITGTIETIDQNKRAMNIKTVDGKFVAVNVPESVKRFSEFKVGNKVKATYNNNVVVRLKPPGEAAVDTASPVASTGMTSAINRPRAMARPIPTCSRPSTGTTVSPNAS